MAQSGQRRERRSRRGGSLGRSSHQLDPAARSADPVPAGLGGWIAPDGRMWRCPDFHHETLAAEIVRQLGLRGGGDPGTQLERRGFIHVLDIGGVLGAGDGMTQAQLDVLFDLARTHPSMREILMKELELHRFRSALSQVLVSDYSGYSNDALVRVHAECKEHYFSLHAKVIRLRNRRQTGTPEYAEAMAAARLQFNVMVAIEDEGKRRGLTLTH